MDIEKECSKDDPEINHSIADDILCQLLEHLGVHKTVEAFTKLEKWYA